jgi:hypothetical protein
MRGYPVFRVPIEAPGSTLGEAANPQVGQFFGAPLGYLELYSAVDSGPPGGARVGGRGAPTTEVEDVDDGPPVGCWR